MQVYLIIALIFSLLVAIFAVQNTETVVVQFLTFDFSISLVLVILGSAFVGAVALFFLGLFKNLSFRLKIRQLNKHNEELTNKVQELENKLSKENISLKSEEDHEGKKDLAQEERGF